MINVAIMSNNMLSSNHCEWIWFDILSNSMHFIWIICEVWLC